MFFQENAQALLQVNRWHQRLIERLSAVAPAPDVTLLETADGNYTLHYKGVLLHDENNPVQEAEAGAQRCKPGKDRVHILLGMGLGYLLQAVFENCEGSIVVYEPDPAFLKFILENVNLAEYLGSGRVCIVTSWTELKAALECQGRGIIQLDIAFLTGMMLLYKTELANMTRELETWQDKRIMDINTRERYHLDWMETLLQNVPSLAQTEPINDLEAKFAGKPALVISSGPSLDQAIDSIKLLADSMVLVAVGGALRRLWQAGITPDFALFYDAVGMKEQFNGLPPEYLGNVIFILCPNSQHECFEAPARAKMFFLGENKTVFSNWIDEILGQKHLRLLGGATVSMVALELAMAMKCDPITLIGQDLAFPNNQVYAGGVMMETDGDNVLKLQIHENLYVEEATMAAVRGQQGETLNTLKSYLVFLRQFEEFAQYLHKQGDPVRLYNASMGGAAIEGYELKPLSEFVGMFESWKNPLAVEKSPIAPDELVMHRRMKLQNGLVAFSGYLQNAVSRCKRIQRNLPTGKFEQVSPLEANKLTKALQEAQKGYAEILKSSPLIEYLLSVEWDATESKFKHGSLAEQYEAMRTVLAYAIPMLNDTVLPWVKQAQAQLSGIQAAATESLATIGE
ncbi:MAG TPA: 6-hydroxymethylpterin diphosphokinase MptE-like protein [Coleofasciculaceae cyanobacterium]